MENSRTHTPGKIPARNKSVPLGTGRKYRQAPERTKFEVIVSLRLIRGRVQAWFKKGMYPGHSQTDASVKRPRKYTGH